MQHLDLKVIEQALAWCDEGETIWLCTVLDTFGSSPRSPGSWLCANGRGEHAGSLSGGCVEEDFLERLGRGAFDAPITLTRYGDGENAVPNVALPCGGALDVLIERLAPTPDTRAHLVRLREALQGHEPLIRRVDTQRGEHAFHPAPPVGPRVEIEDDVIHLRVSPAHRLVIAGVSPITAPCASFAVTLGFEVIVCDPNEAACQAFNVPGAEVRTTLPSTYISSQTCHGATAVVALTHDPRIDDLAMMEAVRTQAFYIGVMGSQRTSNARAERLARSGGLSQAQIARIHMPIGLALGSKTPAEIALAVMADIVRVQHGKTMDAL
ncbi:XdhC family protein [Halomonas sp. PAMB 3264]|uniref:XdhC family protein n=1 Tax=Halomonas sp. PAMB 3264 TaxID=3075222 RepID=UPI0028A22376|nr:XdhC family protein [Halomonas sp. PAMB 3264]WNL42482.1 XdhC family protein [Halomonas sp. PAMB 3264]